MLWGVYMVNSGLNRAFGAGLRNFIAHSTSNRVKGMFSGVLVAAVLQSATAATMIVSSFAARGIISVKAAVAVVLGADIGTTLAAQVLSFDLSWLVPVLLTSGYVINKAFSGGQYKHVGRAMIGVALIMVSLKMIVAVSTPLKESAALDAIIAPLESEPMLAILFAALLTWLAHSSLGMVLLYMSFVAAGTISLHLGMYLVLGANLGSAIAPIVMTMRDLPAARRVPLGNLLMRGVGVVCIAPFVDDIMRYISMVEDNPTRLLVDFHTVFNVIVALMFLPFIGILTKISEKILPDRASGLSDDKPRYLDITALDTPPAALSCAARETLRISDLIQRMLGDTLDAFRGNNLKLVEDVRQRDETVDALYESVKTYLAKLSGFALDKQESNRYMQILTFSTNLEHMGDIIERSLMDMAADKINNHQTFSKEGFEEISQMHATVMTNLQLAQNVFMSEDIKMARRLYEGKGEFRLREAQASKNHFERLRAGVAETISTSGLHLDILRDLRRMNSYLTAVAYPILEEAGELKGSKLTHHNANPPVPDDGVVEGEEDADLRVAERQRKAAKANRRKRAKKVVKARKAAQKKTKPSEPPPSRL